MIPLDMVVDQLLGEFQTVIKPLGTLFRNMRGIGGSTILGSGEVVLILDVQALVSRSARAEEQASRGNTGTRRLTAAKAVSPWPIRRSTTAPAAPLPMPKAPYRASASIPWECWPPRPKSAVRYSCAWALPLSRWMTRPSPASFRSRRRKLNR
ncbi:MAG: chemotaxis protein CheW [Sulfuritalea sp.]|nr:chemotaxis protein CheW [Sulfuritalea sp.]